MEKQNPLPNLPWNIYWINLNKRIDRKQYMEKILMYNHHIRIDAIDGNADLNKYNTIFNNKKLINSNGALGCMMSHIKAMNNFLQNSKDTNQFCFIAEDDCYTEYCEYWKEKHWNLLTNNNIEILQMSTTNNIYNDPNLNPQTISSSGAAFYMIRRDIARKIVSAFYVSEFEYNFSQSNHKIIADDLIWKFGNTQLIPMISVSTIDENFSDISPHKDHYTDEYWENFFKSAINKYLNYWKNLT